MEKNSRCHEGQKERHVHILPDTWHTKLLDKGIPRKADPQKVRMLTGKISM